MAFERIGRALQARREADLFRERHTLSTPQGVEVVVDGHLFVNFCSNDYLGLANDPVVCQAGVDGIRACGVGSGASHLVIGHHEVHEQLEQAIATACGRERALVFSTGYMANIGVIGALLTRKDWVFEDRLNHASLLDGGLASGARFQRYAHGDTDHLERQLTRAVDGEKLIVTDGVFSMDGDIAPLRELAEVARQHDAWLMVDDAHGVGVLGKTGMGTLEYLGLSQEDVPVLVGTLGKAFGTFGAFVAGSEALIEYLVNEARTAIYTTAIPPAVAAATLTSLAIIRGASDRRARLQQLVDRFRREVSLLSLPLMNSMTPIQPIVIGEAAQALRWSTHLASLGIMVTAIRPPTVPEGSARLRVTLCANHTDAQVDRLIEGLAECQRRFGTPETDAVS